MTAAAAFILSHATVSVDVDASAYASEFGAMRAEGVARDAYRAAMAAELAIESAPEFDSDAYAAASALTNDCYDTCIRLGMFRCGSR